MEVVEISREERDVYLIPQNFVDTGTILGGTVKLRNAVEAAVLAVGSAVPLFYLPLAFNIRLMIVIAVSVPLGVFGVVGIGGDSLTQFVAHWFRFMKHRRIVTPTPQGNLEANRHRHLRFISKRYHVVYYEDADALPHNAQVLQRKADRHGKLVKRQTLYDLLPIEKIENGILHTTDDRYIKILEIEPINFLLRSPREQRSVIYSFASLLKVSPVRLQFKSFSRKADVNAYLDKLRLDAANEPDAAVRKRHMSYIRFVKRLGSRDAVSRRFFVIFQYEAPTNERNISYAEIVSTLETTARNFRTYLAQCGNAIVEHENEDEFLTDVFYILLNRRTAVQMPLQERIQDVLASYLAQNDATALNKIPPAAFMIPPSLDLKHGRYLYMDGIYHAYLMIPADGYRAQITAGWMALLVNAGEGIDVDLFLERQPKERMMQKIGRQIRINRSKIKDTSDTNSDFDDLSNAIRSGYYLKDGLANNEDFYYAAILVTVTAASVKDLEWRIGEIRKLMVSQDMNLQLCSFRQEAAFLSSLPLCAPDAALFKKYRRNILTSTAASFYPFVSFELCDTNGVLLGVNKYNNSLVSLDNFNTRIYKNANMAILGTSGAGKTFTMQLIARRMRLAGTPVYIIAPLKGHEFYRQAKALNGTIIRIVPGSPDCINVMEIRKIDHTSSELLDGPMPEQSELAAKIQKLHIFFSLLIPDLSNEERQLLDEAIVTTYRNKGITYSNAMQYKLKHRLSAALMAGAMCCTMIPAASAEEISTPEIADTFVPEITDSVTPDLSQITENLYNDLPDAPTGSYLGSMGLPVATGETKISISAWVSDLYDGTDAHMDADALNGNESTVIVGRNPDADYAVVPLLVQTEYPANSATAEVVLPKGVEVLSYASTDADLISADDAEQAKILHQTYAEQSAAATGFYVKAFSDFTAQFVYASPDGTTLQKSIHVQLSDDAAPAQLYADNGVATLAAGPTPPYATGKITSIAKEGGTWLIWFNGQEAYCCSHGLNGQPNGCPTYTFDHVSRLEPGQYTPGNHYANQINIWGGLGQLSLDMLDSKPVVMSADTEQPDLISEIYDETQQWIITNYPDSYAAQAYVAAAEELADGTAVQSGENGYYTYIYNPPAGYAWQIVALVGEEIAGGTEIPDVPSAPEPQYYSASWTAPAQSARGSFDLTFTVNTDKYQLNTLEKVDGAVITVTPSQTSGSVDGGSWKMTPAGAQTITTSGHTQDDNYHLNGGDGSATWTVHYEVSKTSTSTLSGQEGPFTSQAEADAAAEAAKNAAINQLKNEAQGMVDAAIASARAQLANITFSYDEITIPHGFDTTSGALSSHQTITVPANSSNYYQMKNDEWSVKVSIDKIDSETKQRIKGDAEFKIFEWDTVRQCYIPNGGYNQYKVERQADGTYKVINHSNYANGSDNIYYTQRNEGKFVIVESHAPSGYYGDWTDVTKPGTAGSVLGKRAYAFEITKALDGQTI